MSRNYLDSHQFTLDDQKFCEAMDRRYAARASAPSTSAPPEVGAMERSPPRSVHAEPDPHMNPSSHTLPVDGGG